MNILGLQRLIEMELPIMRNTFLFRNLSDIPNAHMQVYGNQPRWIMRGFGGGVKITDSPYDVKEERILGFPKERLGEVFNEINKGLDRRRIPTFKRLYFVAEVFLNPDVEFSGQALKNGNVYVDICKGIKPSRTDWDPDISFTIPLVGGRIMCSEIPQLEHRPSAVRIARDLRVLPETTYVDFTCLNDGYFFYHDLGQIQLKTNS